MFSTATSTTSQKKAHHNPPSPTPTITNRVNWALIVSSCIVSWVIYGHRTHFPANTLRRDTEYYNTSIFPRHSCKPAWLVLFRLLSILAKNYNSNPTSNHSLFQFLVAVHSDKSIPLNFISVPPLREIPLNPFISSQHLQFGQPC